MPNRYCKKEHNVEFGLGETAHLVKASLAVCSDLRYLALSIKALGFPA